MSMRFLLGAHDERIISELGERRDPLACLCRLTPVKQVTYTPLRRKMAA